MTKDTTTTDETKEGTESTPALRGGLPEDSALDAFAIDSGAALAAFAPTARSPLLASAKTGPLDTGGEGAPAAPTAAEPVWPSCVPRMASSVDAVQASDAVPVSRIEIGPTLAKEGNLPTQCTIMVQPQVRERFGRYQMAQKVETGVEPTNAVVVKRAFLHAHRNNLWPQLREAVRHRQQPVSEEDHDPDGLFGEVPARRVDRGGVKHGVQQSFRPSQQELAVYDAYAAAYAFDNRSDFLDAVLDAFLPPVPGRRTSR
jgi:hypothetical protein